MVASIIVSLFGLYHKCEEIKSIFQLKKLSTDLVNNTDGYTDTDIKNTTDDKTNDKKLVIGHFFSLILNI